MKKNSSMIIGIALMAASIGLMASLFFKVVIDAVLINDNFISHYYYSQAFDQGDIVVSTFDVDQFYEQTNDEVPHWDKKAVVFQKAKRSIDLYKIVDETYNAYLIRVLDADCVLANFPKVKTLECPLERINPDGYYSRRYYQRLTLMKRDGGEYVGIGGYQKVDLEMLEDFQERIESTTWAY